MKLLRKRDIPDERYTNAFLGYGPEDSHFVVELTYSKHICVCSEFFCSMSLLYGLFSMHTQFIRIYDIFVSDYGVEKYNLGSGFGHFGIAVEDVSLHSHVKMCKFYLGNFI